MSDPEPAEQAEPTEKLPPISWLPPVAGEALVFTYVMPTCQSVALLLGKTGAVGTNASSQDARAHGPVVKKSVAVGVQRIAMRSNSSRRI